MKKGDIILIPFPFTNLKGLKNRPAIVLIERVNDVTVVFITSNIYWKESGDFILQPNLVNNLKQASLVKLNKIATIDKDLVLGILGEFDSSEIQLLNMNLKLILNL